jgi:DNA-directed RNA polymerase III subunit RPC6
MDSSSAGPSGVTSSTDPKDLASALYEKCRSNYPPDYLFYQQDLVSLGVVPHNDLALLMRCAQSLVDQSLFRLLHGKDDRLAWKVVAQEDAAR